QQQQLIVSFACFSVESPPKSKRPLRELSAVAAPNDAATIRKPGGSGVLDRLLRKSLRKSKGCRWLHRTEPQCWSLSANSANARRFCGTAADCGDSSVAFVFSCVPSDLWKFALLESAANRSFASTAECKIIASRSVKILELAGIARAVNGGNQWLAELQLRSKSKKVAFASLSLLLRLHCPTVASELNLPRPEPQHPSSSVSSLSQVVEPLPSVQPSSPDSIANFQASPLESEFTDSLLAWSQQCSQGYRFVQISNRHTSFRNGLAFCAIINRFAPWLIDYNFLTNDMRENHRLAFAAARQLGVDRVPDPADLVLHRIPSPALIGAFLRQLRDRLGRQAPLRGSGQRVNFSDDEDDWVILDAGEFDNQRDNCLVVYSLEAQSHFRTQSLVALQIDWSSCAVL
ncbi:hypothetical protein BOX15_Mlig029639g1, partial [Macrostomum lignano]